MNIKKHLWWLLATLGIIILALGLFSGKTTPGVAELDSDDHIKGNSNSTVTLIEYSDFQCPGCAAAYPMVERLTKEVDVKIVYRHFPLISLHQNAELAARASEAAALQNKFWEMHDVLFNTQDEWDKSTDPKTYFVSLAESIDLNTEQFFQDIDSDTVAAAVQADLIRAQKARLPGTPSFFLNGKRIESVGSYDNLKTLVEEAALNS